MSKNISFFLQGNAHMQPGRSIKDTNGLLKGLGVKKR